MRYLLGIAAVSSSVHNEVHSNKHLGTNLPWRAILMLALITPLLIFSRLSPCAGCNTLTIGSLLEC